MAFLTKDQINFDALEKHIQGMDLQTEDERHRLLWDFSEEYRNSFGNLRDQVDPNRKVEERGLIGDTVSDVARGTADLVRMGGYVIKTLDPDGGIDIVERVGDSLVDIADRSQKLDIMQPDASELAGQEGRIKSGIRSGIRSSVPSLTPTFAGAGAGFLAGGPVGGLVGAVLGNLGLFGLGTYGEKKQEYLDHGVSEDEAHSAALKQGLIEGGIEGAASFIGAKIFGMDRFLTQPLKQTVKELLHTPVSTFAKNMAKDTFLNEVPTEMLQSYLGTKVDIGVGMADEGDQWQAAVDSIIPAMTMSLLFGTGASGFSYVQKRRLVRDLNNLEKPDAREKAAEMIEKGILEGDSKEEAGKEVELAEAWSKMAMERIDAGEAIDLNEDFIKFAQLDENSRKELQRGTELQQYQNQISSLQKRVSNLQQFQKPTDRQKELLAGYQADLETAQKGLADRMQAMEDEAAAQGTQNQQAQTDAPGMQEQPPAYEPPPMSDADAGRFASDIAGTELDTEIPSSSQKSGKTEFVPGSEENKSDKRTDKTAEGSLETIDNKGLSPVKENDKTVDKISSEKKEPVVKDSLTTETKDAPEAASVAKARELLGDTPVSDSQNSKNETQADLPVADVSQKTEGVEDKAGGFVHDHSSTQVDFPAKESEEIRTFASKIPDEDLYTDPQDDSYGREDAPHITVKYGLKTNDPSDIAKIIEAHPPITVKMSDVSIFGNDKFDVVKVDVDSPALRALNKKIEKEADISLPADQTYDYSPHATIAYVKPGQGKKYIGDKRFAGKEITFDTLTVSTRDGKMHQIPLKGKANKNSDSAKNSTVKIDDFEEKTDKDNQETLEKTQKKDIIEESKKGFSNENKAEKDNLELFHLSESGKVLSQPKGETGGAGQTAAGKGFSKRLAAKSRTGVRTTGNIQHRGLNVSSDEDAASLLSHLAHSPHETAYTVAVDDKNQVVEVHAYSKGGISSATVAPGELVGKIFSNKGIQKVYFVHNHPAGSTAPSANADTPLVRRIGDALKLRDIETSNLIIGRDQSNKPVWGKFDAFGPLSQDNSVLDGEKSVSIPVKERVFKASKRGVKVTPDTVSQVLKDKESGFILADNQLNEVGYLEFLPGTSKREVAAEVLEAMDQTNATVFIPYNKDGSKTERTEFFIELARSLRDLNKHSPVMVANINGQFKEIILNESDVKEIAYINSGEAVYSTSDDLKSKPVAVLSGEEIKGATPEELFQSAKKYFREELQRKVKTVVREGLGSVRITGIGWNKTKRGIKTDPVKAKLIPAIPDIIKHGEIEPGKYPSRVSKVYRYHHITAHVQVGNDIYQAGVTIGEDKDGNFYYNLNHDSMSLWAKKKARNLPRIEAAGNGPSNEGNPSRSNIKSKSDSVKKKFQTDTTPGKGITLKDIQNFFKGQFVNLSPDGSISVRFKNGQACRIKTVEHIGGNDIRYAMEIGRMDEGGVILGKYKNQVITLNQNLADGQTLTHEVYHLLTDLGIVTRSEELSLDVHRSKLIKENKYRYELLNTPEEDRANTLAQIIADREAYRDKSVFHRIIQKVMDFLDGLRYIGKSSSRKLAKEIESGKIYNRPGVNVPVYEFSGKLQDNSSGVLKNGKQTGIHVSEFPNVELRQTGEIQTQQGEARTVGEVAGIFSSLSGAAQEEAWAVTTSKDGKIIEIHKFSKGVSDETYGHVNQLSAHLLENKDADTTYIVHNHPSGIPSASDGDRKAIREAKASLKLGGIKVKGIVIADSNYAEFDERGSGPYQKIEPIKKPTPTPVSERRIKSRSPLKPFTLNISDPTTQYWRFNGEDDGVLLADGAGREIAFLPFEKGKTFRQATIDILTKAAKHNATNAVIHVKTLSNTNRWKLYGQLASGLGSQGITVLDFISEHPATGLMSLREKEDMYPVDIDAMHGLDSDEALYQTSQDILTPTDGEKKKTYSQIAAGLKGVLENRKNMGPDYKEDIGVVENVLGLMSHYSEKIPALKLAFEELLKRPEWKFQKENELFKNGEESMIGTIEDLQKHDKATYSELKEYLVDRDIYQIGNLVMEGEPGEWKVYSAKDERTGKRKLLKAGFRSKAEARTWSINYEVDEYDNPAGRDALRAFRNMTANLHDFYAESWESIIKEYEARGLTLPDVVIRTKSGEVRIDLKVALAKMGERSSYYFPRQRSNGDWRVYSKKDGEHDVIEYRDFKKTADFLAGKMKALGYEVEVKKVGSMSEDVYQNIKNILSTQAMVNQALSETKMDVKTRNLADLGLRGRWRGDSYYMPNGGVYEWSASVLEKLGGREYSDKGRSGNSWSPGYWFENAPKDIEEIVTNALYAARGQETDVSFEIAQSLVNQLADTLRARGSRARMISRSDAVGKDVPIGYETDPLKAIAQAVNSAAGGFAKQQVALNTSKAITGQHYSWDEWQKQHKDYETLTAAEDHLKNLQRNSRTEEERIAEIDREIKQLQRERAGVKTESEKSRQDRLFRIGTLFREKEKIRKWKDDKQAADAHQEIARLRGNIHREYREYIQTHMIDPKRQKRAYTDAVNAVENVLKNDEAGDRVINTLKGLASVWFLGGRLSSAAINLTALGTTVPAAMDAYGGIPLQRTVQHVVKAGKTYASFVTGKGVVSKADRAVLEDIFSRGWVAAQLNMETVNALKSGPAQKYGRAVELLMTPFKITEEFNRGVTILAAYKGIIAENPGMNKEEALMKAKKVSDRAHGIYGVENQPALLRKGRGLRAASAMYIFQTFIHNYFTTLSYMIGRKQAGAAAYMMLSPMVFGGAASSILLPAVKLIFKVMREDDPEEKIYQLAEQLFGETGEDIARYGLPGLAGVSLKGSLAPGLPDFEEPLDALGPIGGMMRNIYQGAENITHGDYLKGIEKITPLAMGNVAKAYREATKGVTTRAGDPVFFGNEQIKGDLGTGLMRAAGMNPTKIAKPREIQWNETTLKRQYTERKRMLYSRIIHYHALPVSKKDPSEWRDIIMDIQRFNARVKSNRLDDVVPLITERTIKNRIKMAFRPSKRERART